LFEAEAARRGKDMTETVATFLATILEKAGVKRVYGVAGGSLNDLTDALRRRGRIQWVHMRHDEAAAFAAGAEAQLTGELAVCVGGCGPGDLRLINGLYGCHLSGAPVLAIAAHLPSTEAGTRPTKRSNSCRSSRWRRPDDPFDANDRRGRTRDKGRAAHQAGTAEV
jgi:hypothetical protein